MTEKYLKQKKKQIQYCKEEASRFKMSWIVLRFFLYKNTAVWNVDNFSSNIYYENIYYVFNYAKEITFTTWTKNCIKWTSVLSKSVDEQRKFHSEIKFGTLSINELFKT